MKLVRPTQPQLPNQPNSTSPDLSMSTQPKRVCRGGEGVRWAVAPKSNQRKDNFIFEKEMARYRGRAGTCGGGGRGGGGLLVGQPSLRSKLGRKWKYGVDAGIGEETRKGGRKTKS